ncbi:hypothetical protein EJ03DRAFT_336781 [Teratosphaeria nubilosa]|uniref:Uncharacterized protein n=1 Tax=Teratosphaeria nubilosa TaxID=161662 RepID=A0A6G1L6P8_9PEZI|nr:hypothetical protein EJ03DRAFT_336781 [Teratosphaeria nubilosa]
MKFSAILLTSIISIATAYPNSYEYQALGTQSCKARDSVLDLAVYTIEIGEEFTTGKAKCHEAIANLNKAVNGKFKQKCSLGSGCCESKSGGAGMTVYKQLEAVRGHAKEINEAFHSAFPNIGFNCPDF